MFGKIKVILRFWVAIQELRSQLIVTASRRGHQFGAHDAEKIHPSLGQRFIGVRRGYDGFGEVATDGGGILRIHGALAKIGLNTIQFILDGVSVAGISRLDAIQKGCPHRGCACRWCACRIIAIRRHPR